MQTTQFNHAPAQIFMNTGHQVIGRPSLGSWLSYGLGSENSDLPAFVVLLSGENNPDGGKSCWGSGFLPTTHQGVEFRSSGEPVLFVVEPGGRRRRGARRSSIAAIDDLNRQHSMDVGDPEIQTRIAAYELAYRMQTSVPELTDIVEGAGVDPRVVRHRAGQGVVREQLPAGAPAGRARRALRPALSPRLGHARRILRRGHRREAAAPVPADRPAGLRAPDRPEAARPARRHAGRLGRRVRPHADERGAERIEVPRPRSPSAGVHDVAGRRRHQAGRHHRQHRRARATTSSRIPSTCTTCTRRCCGCSGIDHEKLTYQLPGPRLPAHGRARQRRQQAAGVDCRVRAAEAARYVRLKRPTYTIVTWAKLQLRQVDAQLRATCTNRAASAQLKLRASRLKRAVRSGTCFSTSATAGRSFSFARTVSRQTGVQNMCVRVSRGVGLLFMWACAAHVGLAQEASLKTFPRRSAPSTRPRSSGARPAAGCTSSAVSIQAGGRVAQCLGGAPEHGVHRDQRRPRLGHVGRHARGAVRLSPHNETREYFAGQRWLPDDHVTGIGLTATRRGWRRRGAIRVSPRSP